MSQNSFSIAKAERGMKNAKVVIMCFATERNCDGLNSTKYYNIRILQVSFAKLWERAQSVGVKFNAADIFHFIANLERKTNAVVIYRFAWE